MLVLSRKLEEAIVINGEIEIKIVDISGDRVRLGIEAPQSYRVFRKELLATAESNKEAVQPVSPKSLNSFLSGMKKIKPDEDAAKDEK